MTEAYANAKGSSGGELVRDVLCDYFTQILEIINSHGGDAIKFVGDGILRKIGILKY